MANVYGNNPASSADPRAVVQGERYRFTLLSDKVIRLEYSPAGRFVDAQTQIVLNRRFPVPDFHVNDSADKLEIVTRYLVLTYNKKPFSSTGLTIQVRENNFNRKSGTWFYGDWELLRDGNLLGTAVTLDNAVGAWYYKNSPDESRIWGEKDRPVELCYGLLSKGGFSVIDDSASLVFTADGWVEPADREHIDLYFMAFGRDYRSALDFFYQLSGKTPMLPRYALGNWWSRYYSYTQEEYLALQDRFRDEGIPISVGVLDMGWHLVDIDPKYGRGWTGYTWNRELFPDPEAMMRDLHERGMHVSLNVHPADGVRAHEEMYGEMAAALGVDAAHEVPIQFDVSSRAFMDAYFKYLHHPNEEIGVDFWWMDWQQGSNSLAEGFDPLWMLNHYHYLDNARDGKRPLDFSRYAGLGSQRYPIGFSGSSFITWESLDYQPYFTANASNVGYGWWSHDIGGHRNGYRNDELTTRWVQFGVFSPIMRLHSSNEVFTGKEPWKFSPEAEKTMRRFLRLRHRLLPYLYTMNRRFWAENLPLVQPLYYELPFNEEAYRLRNEYLFGSELLVNPVTSENDRNTRLGKVKTLLPEGVWYDVFTGMRYRGGRTMFMFRPIETIPVLAKAGGILPLQSDSELSSRTDNPAALELLIFCGADGAFELYEDDGVSMDYEKGVCVTTRYALDWTAKRFTVEPTAGELSLIPEKRRYTLRFYGVGAESVKSVSVGGETVEFTSEFDAKRNVLSVTLGAFAPRERVEVQLREETELADNNILDNAYELLNRAQVAFLTKENLYRLLCAPGGVMEKLSTIYSTYMDEGIREAVTELLTAW